MSAVETRDGCLWAAGQRVPLLMGEVHYWRLAPARWERILAQVRRLGLSMIATYVPWQYHELEPARFDFRGATEPQRDLAGFLALCRAAGLRVFIRPGPYIYAEWTNAGVPDRVVGLPRISEEYRREAAVWMAAVVDAIRPHVCSAADPGAPVVLFQPDNEFDLFSHWFESPCGLDGEGRGFFQRFLREAYGHIGALNEAWGAGYASFEDARAFAEAPDPRARVRARDYWRFQHWATAEGVRWHVEEYRRLGVDLPMVANYYPGGDVQNWRDLSRVVDLVGIDWYPRGEFGAGRAAPAGASMTGAAPDTPHEEHRRFLDTCRFQRALSPVPWSPELQCGIWHGYHDFVGPLPPRHYRLLFCSALLAGLQGINWYMLVGRDNWYFSPVNERADFRPELADEFSQLHRVWSQVDPPALEKLADACALVDAAQAGTDGLWAANPVLRALYDADADFEVVDPPLLAPGARAVPARPRSLMFYAAADWLAREDSARLHAWVEAGGTLVLFRTRPLLDEQFRPHDALGLLEPHAVLSRLGKKVRVELGAHGAEAEGAVWTWDAHALTGAGAEPIWCTQAAGEQRAIENADAWMRGYHGRRWICGYRLPRGRGAVVQIGLPPGSALVDAVHAWTGTCRHARAEAPEVRTALYRRDGVHYLVAVTLADSDLRTRVALDSPGLPAALRVTDLFTGAVTVAPELSIVVPRRSGGIWRLEAT